MKPLKVEPLPAFDSYTVDFDSSNRPECFHLFWKDEEKATIRLMHNADGYLYRAVREGTKKQRNISLKDLANLPFFTAYIHRINLIDLINEIRNIKKIESIDSIEKVLPYVSATRLLTQNINLDATEKTLKTIDGCGELEWLHFYVPAQSYSHRANFRIFCDGNVAWGWMIEYLDTRGFTASTPAMSLLKYGVDALCSVSLTLPFQFHEQLKITGWGMSGPLSNVEIEGLVNLA